MPPAGHPDSKLNGYPEETAYPSRTIAYQAAGMITSIIEALQKHDQLRYTPAFIVYSLFSALIMHVYQMRSSNHSIVLATQTRISTCMSALRDVSRVWLVAKMVHTLFESILGNKVLEERLQKAAGRRHAKNKAANGTATTTKAKPSPTLETASAAESHKRKFDDMEFGYLNGPPAPNMSYERSRPQSPVLSPSHDLPQQQNQSHQQQQMPQISASSPNLRQSTDTFMGTGTSRGNTRPTSPFNHNWSYPGTPPDLFLHTRNSPKISEDLWQNYQPDQLFPPETNGLFPLQSPSQQMVDPALRGPPPQQQQDYTSQGMPQQATPTGLHPHQQVPMQDGLQHIPYGQDPTAWSHMQGMHSHRPDDTGSNSSMSGPAVPTTLNVGDWFEFFGIPNGDLNALNGGAVGYG
ncbi:Transcriptional activator of fatty acid utilization [Vermiconidia calcicola]|uniref:Transcriptional activator of fatty acid utilization n=1 Tax=Vermiconidia calcicola TaxID=1690605 RepID=A0ACC3MS36_9PEZI|nr:Transcriptional activator of fatty acid utilization [Vermiconidia calcicola]